MKRLSSIVICASNKGRMAILIFCNHKRPLVAICITPTGSRAFSYSKERKTLLMSKFVAFTFYLVIFVVLILCSSGVSAADLQCEQGSQQLGSACWCNPGYYSTDGHAPCVPCESGTSNTVAGSSACQCSVGYYSPNGIAPCAPCSTGSFNTAAGSSTCKCSAGYYGANGIAPCLPCGEGSFNTASGSSTCQCKASFVGPRGNMPCTACPANSDTLGEYDSMSPDSFYFYTYVYGSYYRDLATTAYPGKSVCRCKAGFYGAGGSAPCQQCPLGSNSWYDPTVDRYSGYKPQPVPASSKCLCDSGYISSTGFGTDSQPCTQCSGFTSSLVGKTSCSSCIVEAYRESANSACILCPAGTTTTGVSQPIGVSSCSTCAVGYYSPTGNAPCDVCSAGYSTAGTGQSKCLTWEALTISPTAVPTSAPTGPTLAPTMNPTSSPFIDKAKCRPGHYSSTGYGPYCKPCEAGSANENFGMKVCPCNPGYYSSSGHGPNCKRCEAGSTNRYYGGKVCTCNPGYYSSSGHGPGCARCPDGPTKSLAGMEVCECADGYYGKDGKHPCARCPHGTSTYDEVGHGACVSCVGRYEKGCKKAKSKAEGSAHKEAAAHGEAHKHAHNHLRQE